MKKIYFLMGALAISMLSACHNHDHENEHVHDSEKTAEKENHNEHADEIILTAEKAKAAGIATETVKRDTFRQVIPTGGQILAAQGEETTVVAGTSGVVRFARTLTAGAQIGSGTVLFHLSSEKIQGGDPLERAYVAYQNAKAEYERAKPLAEKQIVTRKDLET